MRIWNNRVKVHHLGIEGFAAKRLSYQFMVSYSKNKGLHASTITVPEVFKFDGPIYQWSWKLNVGYTPLVEGLTTFISLAADKGKMYGDNFGVRLGIRYIVQDSY